VWNERRIIEIHSPLQPKSQFKGNSIPFQNILACPSIFCHKTMWIEYGFGVDRMWNLDFIKEIISAIHYSDKNVIRK
jgi:hypothetical protein